MPQRLLLVLTEFPPSFGGMQTHAVALCSWLHSRGYWIEVATYRLEDGPAEIPAFPFKVHRVMSRVSYEANLKKLAAIADWMAADLIYSSTVYYGELSKQTGLPMLCRSAGNDVLRPWIAWPFRWGSWALDIPWVERQLYRKWRRWDWPSRLESFLLNSRSQRMRESARQMERIFANSDFTTQLLAAAQVQMERVITLPGGVDADYFASHRGGRGDLGMHEQSFYLITACRLVEKKGLDTLLDAVAKLIERGLEIQVLIAGDGKERQRVEAHIAHLGLRGAVHLLGYVAHDRLRDYLHASDLFVLSSKEVVDPKSGLRDAETMGRAICEAAACGLPVVATRSGGIPSLIEHGVNGLLANPDDATDLASQIETLFLNRELAARLSGQARQQAREHFDWPVLFAAHEREFSAMLASKA
jgi:phosphatidyl-myo-inositol dimannoside synthase